MGFIGSNSPFLLDQPKLDLDLYIQNYTGPLLIAVEATSSASASSILTTH